MKPHIKLNVINFFLIVVMAFIAVITIRRHPLGYQLSDQNFKRDIRAIEPQEIAKMFDLKGRAFIVNDDKPPRLKYGFIAQEIEQVFPGMVIEFNKRKYVDQIQLISMIVETLRSYKQEFTKIREELEEVKKAAAKTAAPAAK